MDAVAAIRQRTMTAEESAHYDPYATPDPADSRIAIECGAPDKWGRVLVTATLDGRPIHVDRLDLASEYHRRRFIGELLDRAFGVEPLDDNEFRSFDALIMAATSEEVCTWIL